MSNEELYNIFGIISVSTVFDKYTFDPIIKLNYKNGHEYIRHFTEMLWRAEPIDKNGIINDFLSKKLETLYKNRNSVIDKILNND
jgi:hypothetical protein